MCRLSPAEAWWQQKYLTNSCAPDDTLGHAAPAATLVRDSNRYLHIGRSLAAVLGAVKSGGGPLCNEWNRKENFTVPVAHLQCYLPNATIKPQCTTLGQVLSNSKLSIGSEIRAVASAPCSAVLARRRQHSLGDRSSDLINSLLSPKTDMVFRRHKKGKRKEAETKSTIWTSSSRKSRMRQTCGAYGSLRARPPARVAFCGGCSGFFHQQGHFFSCLAKL